MLLSGANGANVRTIQAKVHHVRIGSFASVWPPTNDFRFPRSVNGSDVEVWQQNRRITRLDHIKDLIADLEADKLRFLTIDGFTQINRLAFS
jgi:hypothetical protein